MVIRAKLNKSRMATAISRQFDFNLQRAAPSLDRSAH